LFIFESPCQYNRWWEWDSSGDVSHITVTSEPHDGAANPLKYVTMWLELKNAQETSDRAGWPVTWHFSKWSKRF